MNFSELTSAVIDNTRRSDKVDLIHRAINLGIKEIVQIEPFSNLRSEIDVVLESNTNQLTLPFLCHVVEVRLLPPPDDTSNAVPTDPTALSSINLGYEVVILDQRTLQKRFPNLQANSRGIPEYCYVTKGAITFVPPTSLDRTVRILVDQFAPELEEDTDENPLPECDNAVIAWASAYVFKSLTLWEDAAGQDREYAKALRVAIQANDRRTGQLRQMRGAMTVRPRYLDPRINRYTRQTYGDISQ